MNWVEEQKKRKIGEERQNAEGKIRLEKERVDHLLNQATALRQANEIRIFVQTMRQSNLRSDSPVTKQEFQKWETCATEQADRLDPIKSGTFRTKSFEEKNNEKNSQKEVKKI